MPAPAARLLSHGGLRVKPKGSQAAEDGRRRVGGDGLGGRDGAGPAVVGSLLILLLASTALGWWSVLLLLARAGCAAAVTRGVGQRMTVRATYGFRRRSARQAAALQPA